MEIVSLPWRSYGCHLGDNWSPALFRQLAGLGVDVLLQDELNHPSLAWLNLRLRRRVQYPLVSIVHHLRCSESHPPLLGRLYRSVERRYVQSVDAFIFNSRTTQASVAALGVDDRPATVAYPAADHVKIPDDRHWRA